MVYKNVDDYIAKSPLATQAMLKQLRKIIQESAPQSEEKISYQMPYYGYRGRLIYFAGQKDYVGLYVMSPAMQILHRQLKEYQTSTSTLKFPVGKPLPVTLIKKIIKAQVAANDKK